MNGKIFEYDKDMKDYVHNLDNDGWVSETILYKIMDSHFIKELINTEVEILEDNTEDNTEEIEELPFLEIYDLLDIHDNRLKINEIIRYIKRKESEDKQ